MKNPIETLQEILNYCTKEFRKGDAVQERTEGNLDIKEVFMMPHVNEAKNDLEMVDVHFMMVGVDTKRAKAKKGELLNFLQKHYPDNYRLACGPSYIEVGAAIGDQSAALKLFALGKVVGLWEVITPASMGAEEPMATHMAGSGFIMISGCKSLEGV